MNQVGIVAGLLPLNAIRHRILLHANKEVRVANPFDRIRDGVDGAQRNLGVQVVDELCRESGFDGQLVCHGREVVSQLVVGGADHADTDVLELRTASTAKNLQHIEDAKVDKLAVRGAVHLGSLDDDRSGRQVDTPGERGSTAEHLDHALAEKALHEIPV